MRDKPYEEMTDEELEQLTEKALREHESGASPFRARDGKVEGTVPISLRIPATLLANIKAAAGARGIPYQRLMKTWLEDALARSAPAVTPKPLTVRLSKDQIRQLRQSGSLDIHLEAP